MTGDGGSGRILPQLGGQVGGQIHHQPGGAPEQARLFRGLIGACAHELVGPVGGEQQEGDACGVGLADGGVEVGHSGARGGHDGCRPHGAAQRVGAGDAQGDESGTALIEDHPQAQRALLLGLGQGVGKGGVARAGAQHRLAHALRHQRLDHGQGRCHRWRARRGRRGVVGRTGGHRPRIRDRSPTRDKTAPGAPSAGSALRGRVSRGGWGAGRVLLHILAGVVPVAIAEYRGRAVVVGALGEAKMCRRGWYCTSSSHHP